MYTPTVGIPLALDKLESPTQSLIMPSVKISRTAMSTIMAASIAELGNRHAKGPSGLGKTL